MFLMLYCMAGFCIEFHNEFTILIFSTLKFYGVKYTVNVLRSDSEGKDIRISLCEYCPLEQRTNCIFLKRYLPLLIKGKCTQTLITHRIKRNLHFDQGVMPLYGNHHVFAHHIPLHALKYLQCMT